MPAKLGFLGTGAITSAIVTGLNSPDDGTPPILLSPRNAAAGAELARRFRKVSVATSNQEVVDRSDTVVLAVRPQIAQAVLSELRFRAGQNVISLVGGFSVQRISGLVAPAAKVTRAVPLPSTAKRRCPTAIFPGDANAVELFARLGAAFAVETEHEFDALATATAIMATYFAIADGVSSWLVGQGIPQQQARDYVATVFSGLSQTAVEGPERSFQSLAADHATRGGLNEQVVRYLTEHGMFARLSEALDGVMQRVTTPYGFQAE
ncbi:MAG TPA: pyrroline-5-carboxylate reductase [Bryobacteraceae bacterium]|nr:pyrroline-5-carboxylate reductase [Bryobacteraceae bacterium]